MTEEQTIAPTSNGGVLPSVKLELNDPPEVREAKHLALRYRLPYVDILPPKGEESPIDYEILAQIPVDLMLRHHFVNRDTCSQSKNVTVLKRDANNRVSHRRK